MTLPGIRGSRSAASSSTSRVWVHEQVRYAWTGFSLKDGTRKNSIFPQILPENVDEYFTNNLHYKCGKPDLVLNVIKKYRHVTNPSPNFLIRAFEELAWGMEPTQSFFATADRQRLKEHVNYRRLMRDILDEKNNLEPEWAPRILFSCAAMEYRFWQILPEVLDHVEANMERWSLSALLSMIHSLGVLNIGGPIGSSQFGAEGSLSRDYSHIAQQLLEATDKYLSSDSLVVPFEMASECAAACFGLLQLGLEDHPSFIPLFTNAARAFPTTQSLDASGLTRFHLYQTLYSIDVLKPKQEEAIKRSLPLKLQERLHETWLTDGVLLTSQPQGADSFLLDVEGAVKRTKTQFLLNTSVGREEDEQHCFFASHLIAPNIAFEYDSYQPLGPDRPKVNGWIQLKQRIFPHFQLQTIAFHKIFWSRLTEDEQDEQILRIRTQAGYLEDDEFKHEPIRRRPYGYKGTENVGRHKRKAVFAQKELVAKEAYEKRKEELMKEKGSTFHWSAAKNVVVKEVKE